jgi:exodeoxyribonuclease-5
MQLSADQQHVLDTLLSWYEGSALAKGGQRFITLGGYAGTGKTTLISVFRAKLHGKHKKLKVAFCSYTGKAARVLNGKLKELGAVYKGDSVSTIHSLIYSPLTDKNEEIIGWERKKELAADLIVIDEASMVNQAIWQDLLTYKKPIIAVGDHGQLPPISGNFSLMNEPVLRLEKIHRQVEDNPIIKVSILARETGNIPVGTYNNYVRKLEKGDSDTNEFISEQLMGNLSDTLILCGYNHTRVKLNEYIRHSKEILDPNPIAGDRVICLRNNHKKKIFNGMLGEIKSITQDDDDWYYAEIDMDDESLFKGLISTKQFGKTETLSYTQNRKDMMKGDLFDFGYAITVHKSQGSQARKVILFEERFSKMDDEMWRRWLYTAVTRAEQELYIIG